MSAVMMIRRLGAAALVSGLLASGLAEAAVPFSFDSAPGRLPKDVIPLAYRIDLTPDLATKVMHGKESVTLRFRTAADRIVFHAVDLTLHGITLDRQSITALAADPEQQLVTLTLPHRFAAGRHQLAFTYEGRIGSGPPGVFAQEFVKPDGSKDVLLSTKFEPTHARRLFACWDEPAFRASYTLSFTGPARWAVVANMPAAHRLVRGDQATTTFQRTPGMPSYLVELSAGDLASITGTSGQTRLSVWAVRGQEQSGHEALDAARQILADYNAYFGYPFPLPKLDSIAVPGGFTGAMENWGAITYNDQLLLITPSSTIANRQSMLSVVAHEMAHQWNGDLVTMGWWDDLWLNESFASWRAAKEVDALRPGWNWWEREDRSKESAMRADAQGTSHAIEQHVTNDTQAQAAFDPEITYDKGQAVLRMLEAWLGPDVFRDGVRRYIKQQAFSNASSADLWHGLRAASGRDVESLAASWTTQPGFPLVRVDAACAGDGARTLTLHQERFLLQEPAKAGVARGHWRVPLQIRSGTAPVRTGLLEDEGQTVEAGRCDQALSVNAGAIGYFRVQYDEATQRTTLAHFQDVPRADRIALLDDQWALVESDRAPLGTYLALVDAMHGDLNERAWEQITGALATIEQAERDAPGHEGFTRYARSVLQPLADRLGWDARADESPGLQKLRRTVLRDLGAWGDAAIVAEARSRFTAFLADRKAITPDDQGMVLGIVAQHADAATFEALHGVAKGAANETELLRYYQTLMAVHDPALAAQAAAIALSDEIPPQAASRRLGLVFALEDEHPALAWQTLTSHLEPLMAAQGQYRWLILAQYVPLGFWRALPPDEMDAWIRSRVPAGLAPNLERGMEGARFRIKERDALVAAADAYLAAVVR